MGQKYAAFDDRGYVTAFYDSADSPPPAEAKVVGISDEEWRAAIAAPSSGKRAMVDNSMRLVLSDPPAPTRAELANARRAERDAALKATDWLVSRHQDEKLIGDGTTLTSSQFEALIKYRQALRDISNADRWPDVALPAAPDFVAPIA
ncbi:phage tail assembly chaperone [Burkholderia multivorans]|uniref:phage tail assembly chaperone n=1 Tax=Burkholderia multivorans TaxID=87883 RepID=UPI001C222FBA|nr:phage tail assembly chaperone [Burkholderia multivorans]MBU9260341.1 phage tail assembly chaperone [Burkholderia multivorans]MBU9612907.1 phage tail assembly chaperone [Burkholderia multivorans]